MPAGPWLRVLEVAKGSGADALRLAVARRLADAAVLVSRPIDTEADAANAAFAIGTGVPGACPTYALLGKGKDLAALPPEKSPDHAPCIQADLTREGARGPAYGFGAWRALAAASALFDHTIHALQAGASLTDRHARSTLEQELAVLEPLAGHIAWKETSKSDGWAPGAEHLK